MHGDASNRARPPSLWLKRVSGSGPVTSTGCWSEGWFEYLCLSARRCSIKARGRTMGSRRKSAANWKRPLNERYGSASKKVKIVFIPTARNRLLEDLRSGRGDIAAANLTIDPGADGDRRFYTPVGDRKSRKFSSPAPLRQRSRRWPILPTAKSRSGNRAATTVTCSP